MHTHTKIICIPLQRELLLFQGGGYETIRVHRSYVLRSFQCFSIINLILLFIKGPQHKISDINQLMRPQPRVHCIENRQEILVLNEKLELM